VTALRSAKNDHVDAAKKRADEQRARAAALEERHKSLEDMRADFHNVFASSATPQARGYAFEKFLVRMARFFGLQVTNSFRIKGTQIDGTIKYDGENYNIEAKWEHRLMSDEPLLAFCRKLEINVHGRGIFISINGYTADAVAMLERAGIKNAVLMDGEDIMLILNEMISLPETLDKKIRGAQTQGRFYIHPITGESKIRE
jgi:restriction endonuclease Mrr